MTTSQIAVGARRGDLSGDASGRRPGCGRDRAPGMPAAADASCKVIQRLIDTLREEREGLSRETYLTMADHLLDLAGLVSQGHPTVAGNRAKVEADIRRYIRQHASEAGLDVTVIATALRWSPRYIQQVLQAVGTTARTLIREERLHIARARLTSTSWAHASIAHISHASGFNSHASFSTAFRARYGITPREVRRQASSGEPSGIPGEVA